MIYSCLGPIGPVLVFGPNNFPLAYNAISGGDFAAAIAAGNPVIAKAHPDHPMTSYLLAAQAQVAADATAMPSGTVQMIYDIAPVNGLRMVADHRVAAIGFTGSRPGGLKLKAAADAAGKPIYLEMSSVNPVFLLPEALERDGIVDEVSTSCLAGGGQFCTCPNLIVVEKGDVASRFQESLIDRCQDATSNNSALQQSCHLAEVKFANTDRARRECLGWRSAGIGTRSGIREYPFDN